MQRERGEENAQPFFTSLLYYTNVIKKGSLSKFGKFFWRIIFRGIWGGVFLSRLCMAFINDDEQSASVSGCFRGLSFENSEHFFDGEFSAARHAVVSDFMVVKDFSGRAIRAVNALVFWFEHFLSLSFKSQISFRFSRIFIGSIRAGC